jgi:hypothetical protein
VLGRGEVAQRRVIANRENCGDEEGGIGEVAVPDGVHAAVEGVEAAGAMSPLDFVWRQSTGAELPVRYDAVLPQSNGSDESIEGVVDVRGNSYP